MTTEELLKPRYKVIALFPFHDEGMALNDIINQKSDGSFYVGNNQWYSKQLMGKFPNCFKPLQWWEERKESDMPQYVKGLKSVRKLLKVEDHGGEYLSVLTEGDSIWSPIWMFQPATEEEYLNQKQRKIEGL